MSMETQRTMRNTARAFPNTTETKKKTGTRKRGPSSKAGFAEVSVVGQTPARSQAMTVMLRGGHSVTFEGATVDLAWLESVLKVVSAC
jgi:hypothetical protein